jgi:sulfite exporter TauE/SafE
MDTSLSSLWFDIAVMTSIFALGNICFGHFEEHQSKAQRMAKMIVITIVFAALTYFVGRVVSYSVLGSLTLVAVYVHGVVLPRNGINGWTGEPRERYYAFRGIRQKHN